MPERVPPVLGAARIDPDRFGPQHVAFEKLDLGALADAEAKLDAAFNAAETIGLRVSNGGERITKTSDRSVQITGDMAWRLTEFAESLKVNAEALAAFAAEISDGVKRIWREQDSPEHRTAEERGGVARGQR